MFVGVYGTTNNFYGALIKLNEDGSYDTTFAANGILQFNSSSFLFNLLEMILTDDNKLLLCGADLTNYSNAKSTVIKLNLDGTYDNTFADNGKLIMDLYVANSSANYEYFKELKKCPNGDILAGGYLFNNTSMIKFNLSGQLIQSFGINGLLQNFSNYQRFSVQDDDKIIVGGVYPNNGNAQFRVSRLNQYGVLDSTFNNNGIFDLDITNENDILKCVLVNNQNSIIISGWSNLNGNYAITHAKIEPENLKNNIFTSDDYNIYPNPFIDQINFDTTIPLKKIEFFDLAGKLISSFTNIENSNSIKISLEIGLYLCKLTDINDNQKIIKLVRK